MSLLESTVGAAAVIDRGFGRLAGARQALVEELMVHWVPPSLRDRATRAVYGSHRGYRKTGAVTRRGLHDWEHEIFTGPLFPRSGHVLIGGVGGGREALALAELGHRVVAFEPCPILCEAAAELLQPFLGCRCLCASYDDLLALQRGRPGRLSPVSAVRFDAAVLGWSSLSHVLDKDDQRATVAAMRAVTPGGPIVASFVLATGAPPGPVRSRLRAVFSRLGAPGSADGVAFTSHGGFYHPISRDDLTALARDLGESVVGFGVRSATGYCTLIPAVPGTRGAGGNR